MTTRELATVSPQEWPMVMQQADMLVKTKFLPAVIDTKEKAIAIMMKGRELGVPPMYALSNIAVISGKPTCTAELMLALIYRDHGDAALRVIETTSQRCEALYRRRGWPSPQRFAFTIEDAHSAGLTQGNWAKYPAAMLRARCISAIARMAFPDTIGGMYTPEELGAPMSAETGELVGGPIYTPEELGQDVDPDTGEVLTLPTPALALSAPLPGPLSAPEPVEPVEPVEPDEPEPDVPERVAGEWPPAAIPTPHERWVSAHQTLTQKGKPPKWKPAKGAAATLMPEEPPAGMSEATIRGYAVQLEHELATLTARPARAPAEVVGSEGQQP